MRALQVAGGRGRVRRGMGVGVVWKERNMGGRWKTCAGTANCTWAGTEGKAQRDCLEMGVGGGGR